MTFKLKTAFGVLTGVLLATAAVAQTELTVYTAVEAVDLPRYKEAFEKQNPDITINWVRDSTGVVTAKLLAEKDNPQADVIWGVSATSLLLMKSEGMLEPYKPVGVEKLKKNFYDSENPPSWVGQDAYVGAICFNTVEAKKKGLKKPTSWKDLTDPAYKDMVVMPNPNSSGTGFLDVSGWIQMFGEDDAWTFMDALDKNIARYTHSGSKPCKLAASGEVPIGISFAFRGAKSKSEGAPIDIIVPSEGVGWDMESAAIVAGTDDLEAAKKLMDFAVTKQANEMYNESFAVVAMPDIAKPVKNFPEGLEDAMIENDFEFAANNRGHILEEWQGRYDSKTEAK